MKLTKKKISKIVSRELKVPISTSESFLNSFIGILKSKPRTSDLKISGFGTFVIKSSPERYGRNPLNMKPYKINARKKLNFRPSSKIKEKLN